MAASFVYFLFRVGFGLFEFLGEIIIDLFIKASGDSGNERKYGDIFM